ncbi:MAG: hypothetical protein M5U09_22230 [Gammaproteobacteria bacterium]|nr:hypothetical protein [Gammaproteobacteria bacterium]
MERTLDELDGVARCAVIVGDPGDRPGRLPARRARPGDSDQHRWRLPPDAAMIERALENVDLDDLDILFIENVGNLVCPVGFDLGQTAKVGVVSVTEGEDKDHQVPAAVARSVGGHSQQGRPGAVRLLQPHEVLRRPGVDQCHAAGDRDVGDQGRRIDRWCEWLLRGRREAATPTS